MKHSIKTGVSFGLTSGIITTLGLIVGLHSSTHSEVVVIGGILTIAIADSFSDALGIHVSEESEGKHTAKEIWASTIFTFLSKFIFALSFIGIFLIFKLSLAIAFSIVWGLVLLSIFSFYISRHEKIRAIFSVIEHLTIALVVIFLTHWIGHWIGTHFC